MHLDPRSLALCRILTALTIFYEATLGLNWHTAKAFLTDDGLWSRTDQLEFGKAYGSLLHAHGGPLWLAVLLAAFAFCAVALGIGWRTRLTCIIAYILWYSLQYRNSFMLHSFDGLTQAVLMWGALGLPWAEVWSVDASVSCRKERTKDSCSLTKVGLWVNVSVVYFLAGWNKSDVTWNDGSAVLIAMSMVQFRRSLGYALCQWAPAASVLRVLGFCVRPVEMIAPVLIAWPISVLGGLVRTAAVAALLSMHLGIALTLRLNAIGLINAAAIVGFLPALFWDTLGSIPRVAAFACRLKPLSRAIIKAARALDSCVFPPRNPGSIGASVKSSEENTQQEAETPSDHIAQQKPFPVRFVSCLVKLFPTYYLLMFTGKAVWFDTMEWGLMPEALRGFAAPAWYVENVDWPLERLGQMLRLDQRYMVFSPRPPSEAFWILMPGTLRNGLQIDAFGVTRRDVYPPFYPAPKHFLNVSEESDNCTADFAVPDESANKCNQRSAFLRTPYATYDPRVEPPKDFATMSLHDDRWGMFMYNVVQGWGHLRGYAMEHQRNQQMRLRLQLGRWTCREWNKIHGGTDFELQSFEICIYFRNIHEHTCPESGEMQARETCVWSHRCFD